MQQQAVSAIVRSRSRSAMETGAGRVFLLALVLLIALQTPASADRKSFVIFFSDFPASPDTLLATITSDYTILYYLRAIRGIALQIDQGLLPPLQKLPGVVAVIPDTLHKPHTTHSWDFLRLASDGQITPAWSSAKLGVDTIIGSIDTGVWPESQSFQNDTMPNVPSGWRGTCDNGSDPTFHCNRKLIGARFFSKGIQALGLLDDGGGQPLDQADLSSPRDYDGHGSHTLSTAGGSFVPGASALGHGEGTAAGGSPGARVAEYKACYGSAGCSGIDILAAMVAAVADGVHVLSISLGAPAAEDYVMDLTAIGAFFAAQSGVNVVCSAGNSGPGPGTATNIAPWIFTVGASTMDRDFPAFVSFGSDTIKGESLADSTLPIGRSYLMISGDKANAVNQSTSDSSLCLPGSLHPDKVKGKIVVCVRGVNARVEKGFVAKQAGAAGMVLCNDASSGDDVVADPHLLAAAHCSYSQCLRLFSYLQSTNDPLGFITTTGASLGVKPAPRIAAFSSRGPNAITPQILKPDITAPGVSVIAAYSGAISPTGLPFDDRRVAYNILSGTSMSCPHVSGIVGLLKTKYPSWSPAMIKSAIMTTASTTANDGNPIQDETGAAATPFGYGSGHVDPVKALDPGLVYDTTLLDYTNFICSLKPTVPSLPVDLPPVLGNLTQPVISLLLLPLFSAAGEPCKCSRGLNYGRPEDLNYPSIAVPCLSGSGATVVKRRLKNVGYAPSKYKVAVTQPKGVKVTVTPTELEFLRVGDEKSFTVELRMDGSAPAAKDYVFGSIVWSDADAYVAWDVNKAHRVRSPIVVRTKCG